MDSKDKKIHFLEEQIAYLENIIALIPGHLYWLDKNYICQGCNDELLQTTGLKTKSEIIGKVPYQFMSPELAARTQRNDKEVLHCEKPIVREEQGFAQDGTPAFYLTRKIPLHDSAGTINGLLGISVDITERKRIEQQLQIAKEKAEMANRAKNNFIANVQHDLRTPCSGVAAMAAILQSRETDAGKKEILECIASAAAKLLATLDGILQFTRYEYQALPLTKVEFDLQELLNSTIAMVKYAANSKGLSLRLNYAADIPKVIIGDEQRISRILLNLVNNAVKFTDKGEVVIITAVEKWLSKNKIILRIAVKDSGIGIPKNQQHVIYERFTRITPANKAIYDGSGLGLSIVKQFVEDLNGTIEVDSDLGCGATFTCRLPLEFSNAPSAKEKAQKNVKDMEKWLRQLKLKVLLVEDDKLAQKVAIAILREQFSLELDIAGVGKQALALIAKQKYDLIFIDMGLPDISGCEVAAIIRQQQNGLNKSTFIIALTAHGAAIAEQECLQAGMNEFLIKPLDYQKVCQIVDKWFISRKDKANLASQEISKPAQPTTVATAAEQQARYAEVKPIDLALGAHLVGDNPEVAKEVLSLLVQQLRDERADWQKAVKQNDTENLSRMMHKLYGGTSYCGTPLLTVAAKEMLLAARSKDSKKIRTAFKKLEREIDAVLAAYRELE